MDVTPENAVDKSIDLAPNISARFCGILIVQPRGISARLHGTHAYAKAVSPGNGLSAQPGGLLLVGPKPIHAESDGLYTEQE
jgi:hypothetical protein